MKLKKLLALALAGVITAATLTACTPLDAAELVYDSIFGGGSSSTGSTGSTAEDAENRAVAEGVADLFMMPSSNVEVSYSVPELTSTIRPAFTPDWFLNTPEGIIYRLDEDFPIDDAGQTLKGFLENSLNAYEQSNFVSFVAFDSTGMSALQQVERFSSGAPAIKVHGKGWSPTVNTKLCVGVCHKTVEGLEYCLVVVVRAC